MAKYRLLTIEELQELEKEFVEYLILNGIAADDWLKMKNIEPGKANRVLHLFSDVVFEKIMRKTKFVEKRLPKRVEVFQCLDDKFVIVCLDASKIHGADFNTAEYLVNALNNPPTQLEVFTYIQRYQKPRELEIYSLIENGGHISDDQLFKTLCLLLPQ